MSQKADKMKALETAIGQIERQFGKGSLMRLGERSQIIDSVVRGPAIIGNDTIIRDSYIGPYTAIGDNVVIECSEIEHSIVMNSVTIKNIEGRIDASLIAENAQVIHALAKPQTHRLVLAENSVVQFTH